MRYNLLRLLAKLIIIQQIEHVLEKISHHSLSKYIVLADTSIGVKAK